MSHWQEWHGGRCPVHASLRVQQQRRADKDLVISGRAGDLDWLHNPQSPEYDVVRWRLEPVPALAGEIHIERDPHGTDAHAPGAKLDAGKTRLGLVLGGFAHALEQVGQVGTFGARKYTDDGWMSVPQGVERYTDAMLRHWLAEHSGPAHDEQTGLHHAAHLAWNALARLELMLRQEEGQP